MMPKLRLQLSPSSLKRLSGKAQESDAESFSLKIRKRINAIMIAIEGSPNVDIVFSELLLLLKEIEHMDSVISRGDDIIEALVCEIAELTGVSFCDIN